jgi:hypothetical protein
VHARCCPIRGCPILLVLDGFRQTARRGTAADFSPSDFSVTSAAGETSLQRHFLAVATFWAAVRKVAIPTNRHRLRLVTSRQRRWPSYPAQFEGGRTQRRLARFHHRMSEPRWAGFAASHRRRLEGRPGCVRWPSTAKKDPMVGKTTEDGVSVSSANSRSNTAVL